MAERISAPGDTVLLLSEGEAKALSALLFTAICGGGPVRTHLDNIRQALRDVTGDLCLRNYGNPAEGYHYGDPARYVWIQEDTETVPFDDADDFGL